MCIELGVAYLDMNFILQHVTKGSKREFMLIRAFNYCLSLEISDTNRNLYECPTQIEFCSHQHPTRPIEYRRTVGFSRTLAVCVMILDENGSCIHANLER